jgi:predicted Zn-dependent peptidase
MLKQKSSPDFYENYIKTINAVTAEDVLNAANKYFLIDHPNYNCRKGSDVIPG